MSEATRPTLTPGLLGALGFVAMAGSLATDLYLPAFPDVQDDLGVSAPVVQLTLTAFLVGAAIGQFSVGTVSDALGRRRTLLVALSLYAFAGFGSALLPTIEGVIALRFLQGVFGAVGAAVARAIVADIAETKQQATRGISIVVAMLGVGPVFGSPLGAVLVEWGGWRLALTGLATLASAMVVVTALAIPESLPPEDRHPARIRPLLGNLGRLLRDGPFVGYALSYGLTYGAFVVYIGSSSFIVQSVFDRSPMTYSLAFSASSLCFVGGALLNARLAKRIGAAAGLRAAHIAAIAAAGALVVLASGGALTFAAWVPLSCVFVAGIAGAMSNTTALALGRAGFAAGAGSATLGLFQYVIAAPASPLGGLWGDDTALPATIGMAVGAAFALCAALSARAAERHR
ncbi:Bcr/CflA family efflux MFS transporter [Microbacterium halophytorum]|uniref:Bcr/CflA family efflux MFS transporter n=1 Tax=Microbacterium halophytorum TaxID=2067568 RepID=UPI000CFAC998|nr:Bcr/CflA family efflux MFS transporter [Microbacterium halophytorum]